MTKQTLGITVKLDTDYDTALTQVTEALKAEGFGILTSIDMKKTLKEKIDVDFRRYTILGACNPPLAHRALNASLDVGMLLPCNVTVSESDAGGVDVALLNPMLMSQLIDSDAMQAVAEDAHARLTRVAAALGG